MKEIKIGNKLIGEERPCFIIAEIGVNHNGKIDLAKKLIDKAKEVGADAVKFQTFKAEDLVIKKAKTEYEMLKKLEIKEKDFGELKKYCDKKNIIFLSTPHTNEAIDFLEPLVPAYKVGSGDLTNLPFLKKVAQKKKPIILSTGMATLKETEEAVETILPINKELILLHCTTNYPCPPEEVNLTAMETMEKRFNLAVGYSDHTEGIQVALDAVILGARIIERHFTLDKNLIGPDHKASLEPKELKEMITEIRNIEKARGGEKTKYFFIRKSEALGDGIKKPVQSELKIGKIVRKSIIAADDIKKGTEIKESMLVIKRPGTGIQPKYLNKIIGKKAKKNIKKDSLIKFKDLI